MYKLCQLVCKDLLGFVQLAAFPFGHLVDLLKRKESKKTHTFDNVSIVYISPVLVEIERGCLIRIKPYSSGLCFSHLFALRIEKQCDGHGIGILAKLTADQLGTAKHVAPLVIATELHVAAVFLVQHVEVVALHDHVVKFQEA